jgi:hypothetical protein
MMYDVWRMMYGVWCMVYGALYTDRFSHSPPPPCLVIFDMYSQFHQTPILQRTPYYIKCSYYMLHVTHHIKTPVHSGRAAVLRARGASAADGWCEHHFISPSSMKMASRLRQQYAEQLGRCGGLSEQGGGGRGGDPRNRHGDDGKGGGSYGKGGGSYGKGGGSYGKGGGSYGKGGGSYGKGGGSYDTEGGGAARAGAMDRRDLIVRVRAVIGVALGEENNVCWRQSSLHQPSSQQQGKGGGQSGQLQLRHGTPAELGDDGYPTALVLHPKSIAPSATLIIGEQGDAGHEQDEEKAGGWQWLVYEEKVDTGGRATWASGVTATPPLALLLLTALAPTVRGLARAAGYRTADGKAVDASVRLTSTTCSALSMCCSKREAALLLCLHSALQHRTTRSAEKARGWQLNAALLAALSRLLGARALPAVPV